MISWWIALGVLIVLSVSDIKSMEVPAWIVVCGIAAAFVAEICQGTKTLDIFTGMIPGATLCVLSFALRGKMGFGDGLVLCMCGEALGFWETLTLLFIASVIAAVFSGILLIKKKLTLKTELPFLPFLLVAYAVEVFI